MGKSIGDPGSSPSMRAASCTRATLSLADSETAAAGAMLTETDFAVELAGRLGFSEIAAASAGGVPGAPSVASFGGEGRGADVVTGATRPGGAIADAVGGAVGPS